MKLSNLSLFAFIFATLSLTGFSSCVSTDTEVPDFSGGKEHQVILNLDALNNGTRASADHSGHKLRYIAKLYRGSFNNINENTLQRKELLAGDAEPGGRTNQIIFYVDPDKTYTIFVYADYIPESTVKNSDGEYGDYYYDTHSGIDRVSMLASPKGNTTDLNKNFFNNDNYDFFSTSIQIEKKAQKEERDLVLKRSVAKVRFVDESDNNGNYDISVTYLSRLTNLYLYENSINAVLQTKHESEIKISSSNIPESTEKEILFFYTFAKESAGASTLDINLKVAGNTGASQEIEAVKIPLQLNYITTVKGKFLPSGNNTPGGNNPGGNDSPGGNDGPGTGEDEPGPDLPGLNEDGIYLNLSVSTDQWNDLSSSWEN